MQLSIAINRYDRHVPFFNDTVSPPKGLTFKALEVGKARYIATAPIATSACYNSSPSTLPRCRCPHSSWQWRAIHGFL